jgi:hypothetical protein
MKLRRHPVTAQRPIPVGSRDAPHRPACEWSSWFHF